MWYLMICVCCGDLCFNLNLSWLWYVRLLVLDGSDFSYWTPLILTVSLIRLKYSKSYAPLNPPWHPESVWIWIEGWRLKIFSCRQVRSPDSPPKLKNVHQAVCTVSKARIRHQHAAGALFHCWWWGMLLLHWQQMRGKVLVGHIQTNDQNATDPTSGK